jgi:mono/diheme cytochrome c family protein
MTRFLAAPSLVLVFATAGCGAAKGKSHETPAVSQLSLFDAEVGPILEKNCGACHSEGATHSAFVGDEAMFRSLAADVIERVTSENPKVLMPPVKYRRALTDTERAALLSFLGQ